MKTLILLSVIASVALLGCSTPLKKTKLKWVNPKVSEENRQTILDRDGNQCHREALIKISAVDFKPVFQKASYDYNYYRGLYSGNTAPVYGNSGAVIGNVVIPKSKPRQPSISVGEAFTYGLRRGTADRRVTQGSYNSRMLAYIKSCMASKGWRQR